MAARAGAGLDAERLRRELSERLPDYMIPSSFTLLEAFPLTLNGKLDYEKLPDPRSSAASDKRERVPPTSAVQRALAEAFAEALGRDDFGVHDNFFALGGDSIRSLRVVAAAESRGLRVQVRQLFEHPSIAGLEPLVEAVSTVEATAPFELLREQDRGRLPQAIEDAYPLSRLQAGLIFHSEHSVDHENYVTTLGLRTSFDEAALTEAWRRTVARHAMLRTTFDLTSYSEPLQLVHAAPPLAVQLFDMRSEPAARQRERFERWLDAERRRTVRWERGPLATLSVHRWSDDVFQLTLSEPFLDGWSVGVALSETLACYRALVAGVPDSLSAPRIGFRDALRLEREAIDSAEHQAFWARELAEAHGGAKPWTKGKAGAPEGDRAQRVEVEIPARLTKALGALAEDAAVPLKTVLLAAHARVVQAASGGRTALTGLLSNVRPETADGERIVGLFVNATPFRLALPGGSWRELIEQTRRKEAEILAHRRTPFAELQKRHGNGGNLFETIFNFTHFHVYDRLDGIEGLEALDADATEQTYFGLTAQFHLDRKTGLLRLALDYRAIEMERAQAEAFGRMYRLALEAAVAHEGRDPYEETALLSAEEKEQVLDLWNRTAKPRPSGLTLHGLIESQAGLSPDAPAVVDERRTLTYAELTARADALAARLLEAGLRPEGRVGVLLERSVELAVALLAVLKAGGAFTPIDAEQPPARTRAMLEDAGARWVLTDAALAARAPHGASVILVDERSEASSAPRAFPAADEEQLAYVVFTSGSTGRPKGAMNTHRAIVNRLLWMRERYGVDAADRILHKTPLSFDVAVWELFLPLISGGALIMAQPGAHLDPDALQETIERRGVTMLHFVPSVLALFLDAARREACASLRHVISSGEALTPELAKRFWATLSCELHNLYGPAEAAVDVTEWPCEPVDELDSIPIGRPIDNVRVYVLDESLQPVPIGFSGELFLGGVGVGRGYVGRPDLTAERFIPDPWSGEPGARLYRTGDLARHRADGAVEYLGRLDRQTKVHGARIELGEIEHAARALAGVREAYVAVEPSTRLLHAFVTAAKGASLDPAGVRKALSEALPPWMIPGRVHILDQMPLTPNGKLDRRALEALCEGDDNGERLLERIEELSDAQVA
ncbi:MAG: amino acid adenylation domain-containing protein, partial [Acidobacteria bacterium]|nr:amino acid adenylation domain-containing protein [Acidobacteriota bacterium]